MFTSFEEWIHDEARANACHFNTYFLSSSSKSSLTVLVDMWVAPSSAIPLGGSLVTKAISKQHTTPKAGVNWNNMTGDVNTNISQNSMKLTIYLSHSQPWVTVHSKLIPEYLKTTHKIPCRLKEVSSPYNTNNFSCHPLAERSTKVWAVCCYAAC